MITDPIWSQSRICREAESTVHVAIARAPRRSRRSLLSEAAYENRRRLGPRGFVGQVLAVVRSSRIPVCSQDIVMILRADKIKVSNILQNLYLENFITRTSRGHYIAADL